jgi:hypothetical protein
MGLWSWFKNSQTPKKRRRRDDLFMAPPLITADPFMGAVTIGVNVAGKAADAIARRKKRKRKKVELPEARLRRG